MTTTPVPQPAPVAAATPQRPLPATLRYDQGLLDAKPRWWKSTLAILSLVVAFLILSTLLTFVGVLIDAARGVGPIAGGGFSFTPTLFLMNNLSLAALGPIAGLLQWAFYGRRPRYLHSVEGKLRWGWLLRAAVPTAIVFAIYMPLFNFFMPMPTGEVNPEWIVLAVIICLTTPLQAAGEEYGCRGLILRAVGSHFGGRVVGFVLAVIISSIVFMIAHFASDPWLIAYYFVFAVIMCLATRLTGGLEVAVVLHAINNLAAFLVTIRTMDLDAAFERGVGAGSPIMLIQMAVLALVAAGLVWWSRRRGLQTTVAPTPAPVATPAPNAVVPSQPTA